MLVGLQREWAASHVAGIRTFALITVLGTLMGRFVDPLGIWMVAAGLLALAAMMVVANLTKISQSDRPSGLTTQVSALIMYMVGVAIALDENVLAVIVSGLVAVLLHWKEPLHGFVERIGEKDIRAIIQLTLIGLIILPLLPNETYGPYHVINPYEIWLMVVLICGISLGSFMAYKYLGPKSGAVLGAILGGLISSTATTVSYSRRSKKVPQAAGLASVVIMIASTIVFGRVIFEIALVSPKVLPKLAPPLLVMMGWMILVSAALYLFTNKEQKQVQLEEDPSDLKAALVFGVLYGVVLFAVAAVRQQHLGDEALYAVAALSGLTDMDAITLSTVQLIKADRLTVDTGWRMILIGAMSNLVFKACAVAVLGNRQLFGRIFLVFAISMAGGAALLVYWP